MSPVFKLVVDRKRWSGAMSRRRGWRSPRSSIPFLNYCGAHRLSSSCASLKASHGLCGESQAAHSAEMLLVYFIYSTNIEIFQTSGRIPKGVALL